MRAFSRISLWLAFAGLVVATGLIGWAARRTWAHNIPQQPMTMEIQTPKPAAHEILELAQAPADPIIGKSEPVQSNPPVEPATPEVVVPGNALLGTADPTPASPQNLRTTSLEPLPLATKPVGPLADIPATAADSADPEKAVQSFVEQNQKVAETQLKNLRDEQAKLRARLQKVEAGIKRWEILVEALKVSKNGSVVSNEPRLQLVPRPTHDTPDVLDAIPKGRIGPPSQPK